MEKEIYILTFICGGIIEGHTLTPSEEKVRKQIIEFAKEHEFKIDEDLSVFEMVDEIKGNSGFSSYEIHLETGCVED